MEWMIPDLVESMTRSSFVMGFLAGMLLMLLPFFVVVLALWLKREVKDLCREIDAELEKAEE